LFGSTIQSWSNNASEMKKLAARDFEDLFQVFLCSEILWYVINDELLVQHSCVRRLTQRAFQLSSDESSLSAAEWHAFAKMRMHTDSTLTHLKEITKELEKLMRKFEALLRTQYATVELPREAEARNRRDKAAARPSSGGKQAKLFNLFTYKWHALADYVPTIQLFGGSDGFSTQIVRLSCFVSDSLTFYFREN
jgi:hypothetical protein